MRKSIAVLFLLCVWLISVASSPVVTGAKVRINARKYDDAIKVLEENKDRYPDDPELFFYLGEAYARTGKWEQAGINYSKALKLNPERKMAKDIDKARERYWASFVRDANAEIKGQNYFAAIRKFRLANMINPDRQESYANLAVALIELAQLYSSGETPNPDSSQLLFGEAKEALHTALSLDPENEIYIKNLGVVYSNLDQPDSALIVYNTYLEKKPGDFSIQSRMVTIYMKLGKFDEAIKIYDRWIADDTLELSSADLYNAGSCYYQAYYPLSKKEDQESKEKAAAFLVKADTCFVRVVLADPKDCESATQLYYIQIAQEKWQEVVSTIERMLKNGCPRDNATLQNLGVAYKQIGDTQKAIQVWKEAEGLKNKGTQ